MYIYRERAVAIDNYTHLLRVYSKTLLVRPQQPASLRLQVYIYAYVY